MQVFDSLLLSLYTHKVAKVNKILWQIGSAACRVAVTTCYVNMAMLHEQALCCKAGRRKMLFASSELKPAAVTNSDKKCI